MHLLSACCLGSLLIALICEVGSLETVIGLYGETIQVPCNNGATKPKDLFMTKWKYGKGEGVSGDLMVRMVDQKATVVAVDDYKERVSMAENASLLIAEATLSDQTTFTCMVVAGGNIVEYPVHVLVHKAPSAVEITDKAEELEIGKLTKLGHCSVRDANPAANITWLRNKTPLTSDGKGIVFNVTVQVDAATGLSTTSSTLEYTAEKEDAEAQFTCVAQQIMSPEMISSPATFSVTYPTESVSLQVLPVGPLKEGDSVTLKCKADGNPPPTSFNFHVKGEVVKVEDSDVYTLTGVGRDATGEYKCSLVDDPKMEASANITVNYLDMNLSPSGEIVKSAGEALALILQTDASGEVAVSWKKDGVKINKEPKFDKLTFSDSGLYECEVTMGALSQKDTFKLVIKGAPAIRRLTKQRGEDGQHEVLICEAEGSPKPAVYWSINGSSPEESSFASGRVTYRITVVPTMNLTVNCTVSNDLGQDTMGINVSSLFEEVRVDKQEGSDSSDQTKVVVGVVVGLLLATVVVGLAYWIYMKKSKQGSWKTGEKENGSSEEEKKLEEKVEENSQKAEV